MPHRVLDEDELRRYAARLGLESVELGPPDAQLLAEIQVAHLLAVPFENLSIHLGEPIVLDVDRLLAKVLDGGRGGFCYELNTCFATLLRTLGFDVTMLEGRVYADGTPGPRFDHMALQVDLDEPWLVDVGFGSSFERPLRLAPDVEQTDPRGTFAVRDIGDGWHDLVRNGEPQYRFSSDAHDLADYAETCTHHQTSPESPFTKSTVCSLMTPDGRVSIGGRRLVTTTRDDKVERTVHDDTELIDLYRTLFGIALDRIPGAWAS